MVLLVVLLLYSKVHIEFCDEENKIVLEGPHDEVESVYAAINEKANDLVSFL